LNTYEAKKAARIERLERRIERLEAFSKGKDLSMFGESRSGIPLGQPIIVGHHSERRHRRHLERIDRIVRAGYDAQAKAAQLKQRIFAINENKSIASDNPDASDLVTEKIKKLEARLEYVKRLNKVLSKFETIDEALEKLKTQSDGDSVYLTVHLENQKHWYASRRIGLWYFNTTNLGAEIRRLKKRLDALSVIQSEFTPFEINGIKIDLVDGQIQVEFPYKPNEATREKLKRSPLALKWSSYSKKWVRKHTETTCGQYFQTELRKVLEVAAE
jgi:hypothetical protein